MSQQSALERLSEDSIVIAFDYGLKRIGVAVGNLLTKSARPLRIIHWKKNDQKWAEITQVLSDWQPAAVVVGVPRHKDGKPNDMTPICERFANQVEPSRRTALGLSRPTPRLSPSRRTALGSSPVRRVTAQAPSVISRRPTRPMRSRSPITVSTGRTQRSSRPLPLTSPR